MNLTKSLRSAFLPRSLLAMAAALVATFTAPSAHAVGIGGGAGPVSYNIPQEQQQGNMPYSNSYTLIVTSPSGLPGGNYQVNLDLTLLTAPAGVTNSQALGYVTITSNTTRTGGLLNGILGTLGNLLGATQQGAAKISFTGPNQQVSVTVTTNIPLGNWAGSFGYKISTSGWATSLGVTDGYAFINDTISFPPGLPALPVAQILSPVDETTYTYVAGGPALEIPYSFVGSTPDGSPLLSMNASVNGQDLGIAATGLNVANTNATASGSFFVSTAGIYTITVNDANTNGIGSSSVQIAVNVQAGPPTVVINTPDPTVTYPLTGNEVDVAFTFTGTSLYGGITGLSANIDGTPITISSNDINNGSLVALGTGTMALLSVGTHHLWVTATDNYGTATAEQDVIVTTQTTVIPPMVNITSPTANQAFSGITGNTIPVTLTFNGTTTGDGITSLTATLDGSAVTFNPSGLNTQLVTGTANVSYTVSGNHVLVVTAINDGGTATATQDFSVNFTQPQTSTLTVAITKPAPNSVWPITTIGGSVCVPAAFIANSTATSGVTSLTVTVDGKPLTVTPTAFGKPSVTATGNITLTTAGAHTITVTANDATGIPATATETINVTVPLPCPKVTITQPCDGSKYTLGTSSCPLYVQVCLTANTTAGATLSTLTLTLNGQPVTLTSLSGIGKVSGNGSVNMKITSAGTYTLVATTTSGGATATDTNTFTVSGGSSGGSSGGWGCWGSGWDFGGWGSGSSGGNCWWGGFGSDNGGCYNITQYTCTPPACNITWQQSWKCTDTQKGGSSVPFCFQVQYTGSKCASYWNSYYSCYGHDYEQCDSTPRSCWGSGGYVNAICGNVQSSNNCVNGNWDYKNGCQVSKDTTVKCVVYELYANGTCGKPKTYTCPSYTPSYWGWGWNYNPGTGCSIDSNDRYNCSFPTASGTHTYRCDVYYNDQNSGQDCLLGSEQFHTK